MVKASGANVLHNLLSLPASSSFYAPRALQPVTKLTLRCLKLLLADLRANVNAVCSKDGAPLHIVCNLASMVGDCAPAFEILQHPAIKVDVETA